MDASSPIPLYLQLKEVIEQKIRNGIYRPHDRVSSERELSEEYGISRMTVRQALQALVHEGLLYTRIGKGTFVSEVSFEQDRELTGFTEEMNHYGYRVTNRVLDFSLITADDDLCSHLEIKPNSAVYHLQRIRYALGQPMAMEIAHIPHDICPDLLQYDFAAVSLYEVFRQKYQLRIIAAEQVINAALATAAEHDIFEMQSPAAVLRMKRITRLEDRRVIEYTRSVYRGDNYTLRTELTV